MLDFPAVSICEARQPDGELNNDWNIEQRNVNGKSLNCCVFGATSIMRHGACARAN